MKISIHYDHDKTPDRPFIEGIKAYYDYKKESMYIYSPMKEPTDKLYYTLNHEFIHHLLYRLFGVYTARKIDNVFFSEFIFNPPEEWQYLYDKIASSSL